MPAVSQSQQRLMAIVHAIKSGKTSLKEVPEKYRDKVAKAVKSLSNVEAKKFAKTKHKGIPEKVSERLTFKDYLELDIMMEENMKLKELADNVIEEAKVKVEDTDTSHNIPDEEFEKVIKNAKPHELEAMALSPRRKKEHRLKALSKLKGKQASEADLEKHHAEVREKFKKGK